MLRSLGEMKGIEPQFLPTLVVVVILLLPLLGIVIITFGWRGLLAIRQEKSPIAEKLMRPAGESLRKRIETLDEQLESALMQAVGFPSVFLALAFLVLGFITKFHHILTPNFLAVLCGITVLGWGLLAWRFIRILRLRRDCYLGFHGERAAAEELNLLMLKGFRVFHDVPMEPYGNIDHVVVAPSAVYAIETKTRRRRKAPKGKKNHEVVYANHALEYPGFRDTAAIPQAEKQANRLGAFLSKAMAEPVRVVPVVSLPGWFVTNRTKPGIWVLPPKAARQWIANERTEFLSQQLLARIAARLEEKCRDVEL